MTSVSSANANPTSSNTAASGLKKSQDLLTCTIRAPPFSYAHLELLTDSAEPSSIELDNLQVKSYCTAALRQFLGLTGAAIPLDILLVDGAECWIRVPRQDLAAFAAAITAWRGTSDAGVLCLLRLKNCSDWLGTMVGSDGQDQLWNS